MPCDYSKYPQDWKAIRTRILDRARHKCETCGVANHAWIVRSEGMNFWYDPVEDCYFRYPSGARVTERGEADLQEKGIKIVLTISHTDHDITNNADDNLRALCQACHIRHDAQHHAQNAAATRARKRPKTLCLDL
jgi:hypothetical protein